MKDVVQANGFGNTGVANPHPRNLWPRLPGETNKGYDLDVKVNISKGTQLLASYSHYNLIYIGPPSVAGGPLSEYKVNNVPDDQFALFAKYSPAIAALRGLSFTAGYTYTGARPTGQVGLRPLFYLNSYYAIDAGVQYVRNRWNFGLSVHNLLDEYTFQIASGLNRIYPLQPRDVTFKLGYKF